jgi:hypothetical protein
VTRDLLGGFLQDRDTGIVRDPERDVLHFWSEVLAAAGADVPWERCMPGSGSLPARDDSLSGSP